MKKFYMGNAEISVVEHCNLNCSLCNSHAYLIENSTYPLEQFKKDMDVLADYIHFGMLTFMGGEPLLCDNLAEYITYAKKKKIGEIYRVLTNGILVKRMSEELLRVMDVLEISHYPEMKTTIEELEAYIKPLAKKFKFTYYIKDIGFFNKIDTTSLSDEQAQEGFEKCTRIADSCSIFNGYYYKCMRPKTTNLYLKEECGITSDVDMKVADGLEISRDNFRERYIKYRNQKEMLEACKYCLIGLEDDETALSGFKHKAINNRFIVRLYYKHSFIYHTYKKIKKRIEFDEGAHTNGNDYIKSATHDVRRMDKVE